MAHSTLNIILYYLFFHLLYLWLHLQFAKKEAQEHENKNINRLYEREEKEEL